jgi:hypothetical protein
MILANKYIIGVLVACAGIFFCFFGKRFVEITEVLTGVLATFFVLVFLLFSYLKVTYTSAEFWVILVLSLLIGLAVGYFVSKIEKVPVVLLGGFSGYITANFSYQFMLKYINSNPIVVYWLTVFTSVILFGILAYFFYENVMIIATAFIGGYGIMRGISFMAGGFPEEKQIIDLIQNSEYDQLKLVMIKFLY